MSASSAALHQLVDRLPKDSLTEVAEVLAGIELTPEVEAGIRRGFEAAARGDLVAGDTVFAARRERIARAPR